MASKSLTTRSWTVVSLTVLLTATLFAPWAASGSRARSGWALAMSARRLGVGDSAVVGWMLIGFLVIPLLAAGAWVLASTHRLRLALAPCAVAIPIAATSAVIVVASPLDTRWGVWLNLSIGAVDAAAILWALSSSRHNK